MKLIKRIKFVKSVCLVQEGTEEDAHVSDNFGFMPFSVIEIIKDNYTFPFIVHIEDIKIL